MAPNLLVAAQRAVHPETWFRPKTPPVPIARTEIWEEPVPGAYKHVPAVGWFLVAINDPDTHVLRDLKTPRKTVYCQVLHRWMFQDELDERSRTGYFFNMPEQKTPLTFFCLDDGITWVQCFNSDRQFIPGPYERFVLDAETLRFRPMLKGDDPAWRERRRSANTSRSSSAVSSLHTLSRPSTPDQERRRSSGYLKPDITEDRKRNSLTVPEPRGRHSRQPRSRSVSPSPLLTHTPTIPRRF